MAVGLRGRRILVTRPKGQGGGLRAAVEELGGEVVWIPAIETVEEPIEGRAREALAELDRFHWVAFTSENAVRFFMAALERDSRAFPRGVKVAAVGPSTGRVCVSYGLRVDARPEEFSGVALGRALAGRYPPSRILLPRGASGREDLPETLRAAGWEVESLVCYRTRPAPVTPEQVWLVEQGLDAALFASPSAAKSLWESLPETARGVLKRAVLIPIGPSTSKAMEALGLSPAPLPREYTARGLVQELLRHLGGAGTTGEGDA